MKRLIIIALCLTVSTTVLARTVTKTFSAKTQTQEYFVEDEALQASINLENEILLGDVKQIPKLTKRNCNVNRFKASFIRNKVTIQKSYVNGIASYQGSVFFKYKCKVYQDSH
jgi:hypothetical protein